MPVLVGLRRLRARRPLGGAASFALASWLARAMLDHPRLGGRVQGANLVREGRWVSLPLVWRLVLQELVVRPASGVLVGLFLDHLRVDIPVEAE